jgi:hypothetical protein
MFKQIWTIVWAFFFAISFSQIPTFIQQYEQRVGGAVHELSVLVDRYNADAIEEKLILSAYIAQHLQSADGAVRRTGETIRYTVDRHGQLLTHQQAMEQATPWEKPLRFVDGLDAEIARQAWAKYKITLTLDVYYGVTGVVLGLILMGLLGFIFGSSGRVKKSR